MSDLQTQVLNHFESLIERMTVVGYDDVVLGFQDPSKTLSKADWTLPFIAFDADPLWASQLSQLVSQNRDDHSALNLPWSVTAHYQRNGTMSWRLSISEPVYQTKHEILSALKSDLDQLVFDLGGAQSSRFEYAEAV